MDINMCIVKGLFVANNGVAFATLLPMVLQQEVVQGKAAKLATACNDACKLHFVLS